jgi:5-formyltetrahydrofolate cyclo-ligase
MNTIDDFGKNELRCACLARRDALPVDERARKAQALAARQWPVPIAPSQIVAGYMPIRSEIDPHPLMLRLRDQGAQLALPVIIGRDQPLVFRAWNEDAELTRGEFGILQPAAEAQEVLPDIVLVPLAAFDRAGHRIGYGGGYYDRTLAALRGQKTVLAIGVAFAMQEIDTIPASHHDVPLDIVMTESETIDLRR